MRHFQASAGEVAQAIDLITAPATFSIDPENTGDKVLLHFLQHPDDMIDMRRVMQQMHASTADVQHALERLAEYIVESGEWDIRVNLDKK
jgi:hypothetical protein